MSAVAKPEHGSGWKALETEPTALKEWAAVIHALETGETVTLLRKGGIHERGFDVKKPRFLLFPTYLHQAASKFRPEARGHFEAVSGEGDGTQRVNIRCAAEVVDSRTTTDESLLPALAGETIMTEDELRARYAWKPGQALHVLLVRVHRLPIPLEVPVVAAYGGCRSWITLQDPASPVRVGEPVLSDQAFAAAADRVRKILPA